MRNLETSNLVQWLTIASSTMPLENLPWKERCQGHVSVFTETPPLRAVYLWTVMVYNCKMWAFIKHFPVFSRASVASEGPPDLEPSGGQALNQLSYSASHSIVLINVVAICRALLDCKYATCILLLIMLSYRQIGVILAWMNQNLLSFIVRNLANLVIMIFTMHRRSE